MRKKRNKGFVLIELLLAMTLLAAVTTPVYLATRSYVRTNNAADAEIRLQTEANTILETFENAVRNSAGLTELAGDFYTHAIPVASTNSHRSEWLKISEAGVDLGTFTYADQTLAYGGRTLSRHVDTLELALLFDEARSGSVDLGSDAGTCGLAVRFSLTDAGGRQEASRDFLFLNTSMPTPGSSLPEGNLMFGDDECFGWQSGYPLHFNMYLDNMNPDLLKQNQLIVLLEPGLTFNESGDGVLEANFPLISIQYLSDNGIPTNKNTVSISVGNYIPADKQPTRVATWDETMVVKNLDVDWNTDYLNVRVSVDESNYYQVDVGSVTGTGFIPLLSYTTIYQSSGDNTYGFYLGDGFGLNSPDHLHINNDVSVHDTDPDATGVLEIEYLY